MGKLFIILLSLFIITSCVFRKKDSERPPTSLQSDKTDNPPKQPEPLGTKDKDPQIRTDKSNLVKPPSLDTISAH